MVESIPKSRRNRFCISPCFTTDNNVPQIFFISQNQMFEWLCCLNCLTIDWFIDLIDWMSRYMYILAAHFVICLCISCLVGGALYIHWKRTNQGHQGKYQQMFLNNWLHTPDTGAVYLRDFFFHQFKGKCFALEYRVYSP